MQKRMLILKIRFV